VARSAGKYVQDILEELAYLEIIRREHDFQSFNASPHAFRSATYSIQIVSEATRKLPPELINDYPDINWKAIRSIGNVTRHEYFHLEKVLLWEIITVHAPVLQKAAKEMKSRL
jgi:uncharacterized protein with HEPN domain